MNTGTEGAGGIGRVAPPHSFSIPSSFPFCFEWIRLASAFFSPKLCFNNILLLSSFIPLSRFKSQFAVSISISNEVDKLTSLEHSYRNQPIISRNQCATPVEAGNHQGGGVANKPMISHHAEGYEDSQPQRSTAT